MTTFVSGEPCPPDPEGELDTRTGCVSRATNDAGDELIVYAILDREGLPRSWRVRLFGEKLHIDHRLIAGNKFSYPRAIGATDIGDDGSSEWFVKVNDFTSHGAPWSRLNAFVVRGDRLVAISSDGEPLSINTGGITRLGEGARCGDGSITLLRAEAKDRQNTRWVYSERLFSIKGASAHFVRRDVGTLRISGYNDPDLDPYYRLECDGLQHPP